MLLPRSPCLHTDLVSSSESSSGAIAARLQRNLVVRQSHGRTHSLACQQRRQRSVLVRSTSAEAVQVSPSADASPRSVPKAQEWELDFCSRPILDERGKKLWELIICDPDRTFEHTQYFPNNKINSTQVGSVHTHSLGSTPLTAQGRADGAPSARGGHQARAVPLFPRPDADHHLHCAL